MNKVFVSGLVLATLMASTVMSAYAANVSAQLTLNDNTTATQTYGVSFEQTISNIKNAVSAMNETKANGQVSDAQITELANQIYSLEAATKGSTLSDSQLSDIATVLDSAESAISGLDNAQPAEVAVILCRNFYNLPGGKEGVEAFNRENSPLNNAPVYTGSGEQAPLPTGYGTTVEGTTVKDAYTANNNYAAGSTDGQLTGTQLVNSFWDVKPEDWYYTQVQAMVQKGLFAGKGDIVDGVGTFAPNDTMTKAEFVTVAARMFYKDDEINNFDEGSGKWWDKYYNACVAKGIFSESEIVFGTMEQGMSREEMSLVAIRALRKLEGHSDKTYEMAMADSVIPDYNQVSNHLKSFVVQAYADGLLCGTDDKGTFAPKATLTRAEASTVLYRIIESDTRTPNRELGTTNSGTVENHQVVDVSSTEPITIKEGEVSLRRLAREGDTVIKADGSTVVLKKGPNGVLGEGQGVAPDLGATSISGMPLNYTVQAYHKTSMRFSSAVYFEDSTGMSVSNQSYYINCITGEGHWGHEWKILEDATRPTTEGSFDLQLSSDKYWLWDTNMNEWIALSVNYCTPDVIQAIIQANGL